MRRRHGFHAQDVMAVGQGAFWIVSGVWPILHMRSFEAVTGPKVDRWLVKTVGGLISSIGGVLLMDGLDGRAGKSTRRLAVASAAVLTGIDVWYASRGRISKVYLLDAAVESGIIMGWLLTRGRTKKRLSRRH